MESVSCVKTVVFKPTRKLLEENGGDYREVRPYIYGHDGKHPFDHCGDRQRGARTVGRPGGDLCQSPQIRQVQVFSVAHLDFFFPVKAYCHTETIFLCFLCVSPHVDRDVGSYNVGWTEDAQFGIRGTLAKIPQVKPSVPFPRVRRGDWSGLILASI